MISASADGLCWLNLFKEDCGGTELIFGTRTQSLLGWSSDRMARSLPPAAMDGKAKPGPPPGRYAASKGREIFMAETIAPLWHIVCKCIRRTKKSEKLSKLFENHNMSSMDKKWHTFMDKK